MGLLEFYRRYRGNRQPYRPPARSQPDHAVLMAGFTAGNEKGELVVLGRNGSGLFRRRAGRLFTRA
ncbi:hypothetical protein KCP77_22605 [Salmonella enterica subsp. enterica]|nr:hypothetical protein KCP77_22605 [Salmonella enterica subsp. enterica]